MSCFRTACREPPMWTVSANRIELRLDACGRHASQAIANLMDHTHPQQGKRVTVSPYVRR